MVLFGIDPNVQGFNPTPDAAMVESHMVSWPDLVRVDELGNPSGIATLIVGGKEFDDWESVWIQWSWAAEFSLAELNAPGPVRGSALLDRSGHQPTDKLSRNRRE
jgi:hypothetical protein